MEGLATHDATSPELKGCFEKLLEPHALMETEDGKYFDAGEDGCRSHCRKKDDGYNEYVCHPHNFEEKPNHHHHD